MTESGVADSVQGAVAAEAPVENQGESAGGADPSLASVGSKHHGEFDEAGEPLCTPCAWFHKPAGCLNAQECYYCHLCPSEELKNRKKMKVQRMKSKELEMRGTPSSIKRSKTGLVGDPLEPADIGKMRRANTMPTETSEQPEPQGEGCVGGKLRLPGFCTPVGQEPAISEGSKLHGTLDANGMPACHPCAWFHKSSCKNDTECIFCHLCPPGELKNRKKLKIAKLRGVDGATPSPSSPSPASTMNFVKSDKGKVQRASTENSKRSGFDQMWPGSPYDAASGGFMQPSYGIPPFGYPQASPWPYMDPSGFNYDPRMMMGMPGMMPPSPSGLPVDMPSTMAMGSDMPPRAMAMGADMPPGMVKDPKTPVAGRLRDEPPGLSLPPEAPEGKITRINWSVDTRNLGASKKASSPPFQVPGASGCFRMALLPKGGASFTECRMRGTVQVIREEASAMLPGFVSMQISVTGVGADSNAEKEPPRGPLKHDFATSNVFGLPEGNDEFVLEAIAGESKVVNICLEILPPDMA